MVRSLFWDWYGQHFGKDKIAVLKYAQSLMWGAFAAGYKAAQESVKSNLACTCDEVSKVRVKVVCSRCGGRVPQIR
jgi:hypothetical protein